MCGFRILEPLRPSSGSLGFVPSGLSTHCLWQQDWAGSERARRSDGSGWRPLRPEGPGEVAPHAPGIRPSPAAGTAAKRPRAEQACAPTSAVCGLMDGLHAWRSGRFCGPCSCASAGGGAQAAAGWPVWAPASPPAALPPTRCTKPALVGLLRHAPWAQSSQVLPGPRGPHVLTAPGLGRGGRGLLVRGGPCCGPRWPWKARPRR